MNIDYSKQFVKKLKKSPHHIQLAFRERLGIFVLNPNHPILNNHVLHGNLSGYRSINISGDWRALFRELQNGQVIFFDMLGTHSELYG